MPITITSTSVTEEISEELAEKLLRAGILEKYRNEYIFSPRYANIVEYVMGYIELDVLDTNERRFVINEDLLREESESKGE